MGAWYREVHAPRIRDDRLMLFCSVSANHHWDESAASVRRGPRLVAQQAHQVAQCDVDVDQMEAPARAEYLVDNGTVIARVGDRGHLQPVRPAAGLTGGRVAIGIACLLYTSDAADEEDSVDL